MRKNRRDQQKRDKKRKERDAARRPFKRKPCRLCLSKIKLVDHKDVETLKAFVNDRAKIIPRRMSGNCAKHQRQLTKAIKKSRNIGLIPFTI